MQRKQTFLILTLLLVNCLSCAQKKQYKLSAVAFYNLENLFYPTHEPYKYDEDFMPHGAYHYTERIYHKKLHNMALAIAKIATDKIPEGPTLLGVAEVENSQVLKDLVNQPELKSRNWQFIHFESPDARGIDVALLYNPEYFKIINAKALPVNITDGNRKLRTRDVLYVSGKLDGDTVYVFVNHWPSRREGPAASNWKREKAALTCKKMIDQLVRINPEARIILMGDLNDNPTSQTVVKTLGATGTPKATGTGGLYNPWLDYYKKGIGSSCYRGNWDLFDQIILSYGFLNAKTADWQYYRSEVFNKPFLTTQFGKYKGYPHRSFSGTRWIDGFSDHFPTIIYLIKNVTPE